MIADHRREMSSALTDLQRSIEPVLRLFPFDSREFIEPVSTFERAQRVDQLALALLSGSGPYNALPGDRAARELLSAMKVLQTDLSR
jgi:hypothetical protein